MQRLTDGCGVHPISGYLAALPRADSVDFMPLLTAVRSAAMQVSGVPLERGEELEPQCRALWGGPLALASRFAADAVDEPSLRTCTTALAAAGYLSRAIRGYRRDARVGRVPFAIDELMAAGVDNADLSADTAPPHLASYLGRLRETAAAYFGIAAQALPRAQHARHRHLLVLAALGLRHLRGQAPRSERRRLRELLLAWTTARRAVHS